MQILIVQTGNGPLYYSNERVAHQMAAVRKALAEARVCGEELYDLAEAEIEERCMVIENSTDPLNAAINNSFIRIETVRES